MAITFALSQEHGLERVQYGCEHIYTDKQHLHGVVTVRALQLLAGAAPAACVLKVLDFHVQLCFRLSGGARVDGAALGSLAQYVDAGVHRSYEALESSGEDCSLLRADSRYTAGTPAAHGGVLHVLMRRAADCTLAVTLVRRFFKDQLGPGAAELARELHRRPGWQALTMDSESAARIWEVPDLDAVAQFVDRKQLVYGAVLQVAPGRIASRAWDKRLACPVLYVRSADAATAPAPDISKLFLKPRAAAGLARAAP